MLFQTKRRKHGEAMTKATSLETPQAFPGLWTIDNYPAMGKNTLFF